jgi:hypothetical protein
MRITILATSAWLALLGTMALAQSVTYDYDRSAGFSTYRTYAWTRGTEPTDELNHASVVRAIDAALATKGLKSVKPDASPDLVVAYHASFDRGLEITGSVGAREPFGLGDDAEEAAPVQPVAVGTLVVDISDARTHAIVWRSLADTDIRPADKPESRDKKIVKATRKMFKSYPTRHNDAWLRLVGFFIPAFVHP